jgi:hypothetical protein
MLSSRYGTPQLILDGDSLYFVAEKRLSYSQVVLELFALDKTTIEVIKATHLLNQYGAQTQNYIFPSFN